MTKQERLEALQRIAHIAGGIQNSAEMAIEEAEDIPRMDSAEIERLSIMLPQLEETLEKVREYISPLPEKFLYMAECGTTAEEADHRNYVKSQGIWIDNKGIPIEE